MIGELMSESFHLGTVEERVDSLVAEFLSRVDAGEDIDRDEFASRFPDLADQLGEYFASYDSINQLAQGLPTEVLAAETNGSFNKKPPAPSATTAVEAAHWPPRPDELPVRFGDYELVQQIAQGGMGIVYKARQVSLRRYIAVKIVLHQNTASSEDIRRCRSEAEAAARLQHPNIVAIHEVGECDGQQYYSMDLVDGPSLAEKVCEGPLEADVAAKYMKTVSEAIHYAHRRNILHRDLKPSNILIAPNNQPRVTDFGVSKRLDLASTLTATGQIIGTPGYISPEQSMAEGESVGVTSDVYSLGAVLYELLAGRAPFKSATFVDTLIQVRTVDPVAPSLLNSKVPADLETICLKCLAKRPECRYQSAGSLADDLGRFLDDRPIAAKRPGVRERVAKWARRNKTIAATSMTAIVAVLVLITFLAFYNVRLADLNRQLSTSAQESDKQKRHTQRLLYASDVKLAKQALDEHDLPQLTMLLKRHEPVEDAPDERGFAWHYLQQQTRVKQFDLPKHPGAIYAVCYSQDGRKIATAGSDATVRIFDAESHSELDLFATGQGEVNGIAFSPDGQTLATTGDDGTVRIWDVLSHRSLQTIQSTAGEAYETLFAPDGEQLVTTGNETRVHIWDPSTGRLLRSLEGHTRSAQAVAISADGRTLGTASDDGTVKLWEFPAGVELRTIKASIDRLVTIDFSRNGRWVATGGVDRKIDVWETASGSHIVGFEHLDGIQSVAFSTDDKWIAAGDRGGTVHIWPIDAHDDSQPDKKKRQPIVWQAHTGRISLIRFSPDGRQLITVGRDGAVTVWHPFSQSTHRTVDAPDRAFHGMAFTPDGQSLLTIDGSGEVLSWDPTIEKTHSTLFRHASALNSITVSPTGAFLAAGDSRGRVLLGDLKTEDLNIPSPLSILDDQERGSVFDLTFSPNGRALAVGSAPSTIFVIDLVTRESIPGLTNISGNSPVFSPDGRQLALRVDNRVDVWDTSTCKILFVLRGHAGSVAQVAYNPNGRTIATASDDRTVKFWNATDGTELSSIVGHRSPVSCLAFSPQGRSLLSADRDGAIKIWQIATGSELMELERRQGFCMKMLFSVDGRRLACYRTDSSIVVTDLNTQNGGMVDDSTDDRTLSSKTLFEARLHQHVVRKLDRMPPNLGLSRSQQRQTFRGHTGPVTCVDVSDDGNLIASGSHDATVRIWDRHSGALKRTLESQSGRITAVAFQPESALLAVAYEDRSVRVWDLNARGVVTQFAQRDHEIIGLRFNNAGDQLLVAELDGKVTLWDVKSAKALQTISSRLSLHEGFLMDYDEQGHAWLAGRTSQGLVTVRSIAPESVEFEINESVPLCFNLDRSLLVTRGLGYRFAAVGLWDVNRARSIMTLRGHGSQVLGAAFSPDGQLLVTTSSDRTIRVWDVTTGDMRQILTGHCGAVRSPVFTPDGRDLVTCSDDKTVRLWSVTGQSPQRHDSENVQ